MIASKSLTKYLTQKKCCLNENRVHSSQISEGNNVVDDDLIIIIHTILVHSTEYKRIDLCPGALTLQNSTEVEIDEKGRKREAGINGAKIHHCLTYLDFVTIRHEILVLHHGTITIAISY